MAPAGLTPAPSSSGTAARRRRWRMEGMAQCDGTAGRAMLGMDWRKRRPGIAEEQDRNRSSREPNANLQNAGER
jgi:hypothetical protein